MGLDGVKDSPRTVQPICLIHAGHHSLVEVAKPSDQNQKQGNHSQELGSQPVGLRVSDYPENPIHRWKQIQVPW